MRAKRSRASPIVMFALPTLALTLSFTAADASGITWLHDDWTKAKKQAIESGQLVAIDVWATWCHTCLSMKHFVLTEKPMSAVAKQHTYLMLDFDRPENAIFFEKIPVPVLPTFMVVDPKSETVVARWVGSGTAEQMAAFFKNADAKSTDPLVLGNRALVKEDFAGARKIFEDALAKKDLPKEQRSRLLNGWGEALWKLDTKICASEGVKHIGDADDTAPGLDFVSTVAGCAGELEDAALKKQVMTAVRDRLLPVTKGPMTGLEIDDRSGLWSTLIDADEVLGDKDALDKAAAARLAMLEDAASKAKTQEDRATFDAHRFEEYLRANRFDDAEKMLLATEKAMPKDFNAPYRLAVLYKKAGKTDQGLAAVDRALKVGYGARKLRMYSAKVDLFIQKKSWDAARKTVADAKAEIAKMNPKVVRPSWVKELESKLADIDKGQKAGA